MKRTISFEAWLAQRAEAARRCDAIDRIMPPYRRTRPRDAAEVEALRRQGVADRLIGPVRGVSDQP